MLRGGALYAGVIRFEYVGVCIFLPPPWVVPGGMVCWEVIIVTLGIRMPTEPTFR